MSIGPMIEGFRRKRLPRLGKIGLGEKAVKDGREYPRDLPHFDLADAPGVADVYGAKPTELDVMVPCVDIAEWFPVSLKRYGTDRLLCRGDGNTAVAFNSATGGFEEIACGYKSCAYFAEKRCTEVGNLMVILPKVSIFGVFQIDTGSFHGINKVYDAYEMALQRVVDITGNPQDILRVQFRLARIPEAITYTGVDREGKPFLKTVTKALLNLIPPQLSFDDAKQLHAAIAAERRQLSGGRVAPPAALPAPSASWDEAEEGEVDVDVDVDVDESQPEGLYPNAAPPAASLEQRAQWAELVEQAVALGANAADVESKVCGALGQSRFEDLAEEQATEAIEGLRKAIEQWSQGQPEEADGASAGPTSGQVDAWAALLEQAAGMGKVPDVVEKMALKQFGVAFFTELDGERAAQAVDGLKAMLKTWETAAAAESGGGNGKKTRAKAAGESQSAKAATPAQAPAATDAPAAQPAASGNGGQASFGGFR